MAKAHSMYVCQQCGYSQVGWAGRCPNCGAWGSLVETVTSTGPSTRKTKSINRSTSQPVNLSSIPSKKITRISTTISELDRVLGGGLVPGQVTLLAGEPGIGKSTLLLQLCSHLAKNGICFYATGEESAYQIKIRADRLGTGNKQIEILETTDIDEVVEAADQSAANSKQLAVLIVDSIQTMTTEDLSGMAGSVGQVRESAMRLVRLAKGNNVPVFLVGHVTKEGTVAGPAVLAHIVDTVLWFEGERTASLRLLRAVKNRFGPTDEVGIFQMEDKGLVPMDSPEKLFISQFKNVPGRIIASVMEGTRPMLVEVESLVVPTKMAFPKRITQGIDPRRFELLLAVIAKRAGIPLFEFDCFANIAGGIKVNEPAVDLAVCLSLASSYFDKPLPPKTCAVGEVGLLGDIRAVPLQERRIKEARRLGYTNVVSSEKFKSLTEAIRSLIK